MWKKSIDLHFNQYKIKWQFASVMEINIYDVSNDL